MDLILETPGTRVSKKKELLKISTIDGDPIKVPMREVESIIASKGVQITSQALKTLSSHAVNIVYTSLGKPYGIFTPFAKVGTVLTRREQILAYEDYRGVKIAAKIVYASIENKRRLISYFAKNRKKSNYSKHLYLSRAAKKLGEMGEKLGEFTKTLPKRTKIYEIRRELMGIEGKAAAIYFRNYGNLIPEDLITFRRTRRPPKDPVNSLLSLGYTVLQGHITTAIAAAGLELYAGFLHSDRSGKPSLALDLIEEFRQPIIDRLIARLLHFKQIKTEDFENSIYGYRLKKDKKSLFYNELKTEIQGGTHSEKLFGKEDQKQSNKTDGKVKINFKKEMVRQARKLANYLIGNSSDYEPFLMNW
ncbi:MAG: CRISPR-associated endonuclease Cas1 [Promethearchaeia archaeon]